MVRFMLRRAFLAMVTLVLFVTIAFFFINLLMPFDYATQFWFGGGTAAVQEAEQRLGLLNNYLSAKPSKPCIRVNLSLLEIQSEGTLRSRRSAPIWAVWSIGTKRRNSLIAHAMPLNLIRKGMFYQVLLQGRCQVMKR